MIPCIRPPSDSSLPKEEHRTRFGKGWRNKNALDQVGDQQTGRELLSGNFRMASGETGFGDLRRKKRSCILIFIRHIVDGRLKIDNKGKENAMGANHKAIPGHLCSRGSRGNRRGILRQD
ncbi:MAG: hypothetical protein H7829_02030 [Magnetococcus sp. THC-1_WYH]